MAVAVRFVAWDRRQGLEGRGLRRALRGGLRRRGFRLALPAKAVSWFGVWPAMRVNVSGLAGRSWGLALSGGEGSGKGRGRDRDYPVSLPARSMRSRSRRRRSSLLGISLLHNDLGLLGSAVGSLTGGCRRRYTHFSSIISCGGFPLGGGAAPAWSVVRGGILGARRSTRFREYREHQRSSPSGQRRPRFRSRRITRP